MILKGVYFQLELLEFSRELVSVIGYQSRSLSAYLGREQLKPLRFKTDNFNRIVVIGSLLEKDSPSVNSSNSLNIKVKFNEDEYKALDKNELNEYFISMLIDGFTKTNKQISIPLKELLDGMEAFRAGGYENKWTAKTRQFKTLGIKCQLNCNLTMDNFHLNLLILKGKEVVFNEEILKTKPDEIFFERFLNDVKLDEDKIVVIGKRDKIVYELNVNDF